MERMETVQPGHSSSTMLAEASLGNSQRLTAALLSQDAPRESKAGLKRPRSAAHVTLPPRPAKKSTPVAVVAPSPIIPSPICAYCTGGPHHCVKTDAPEILISCNECGSSGHPSCLDWDNDDTMLLVTVQTYDWKCINCKSCERCQRKDESVMMCDRCDRGWHLGCLDPPLKNVPEGIWSCPTCVQSDVQAANGNGQPRKGIHQPQPSSSLHEPTSRFKTRPAHASAMRRLSMAKVVPSSSESGQLSQDSSAEPSRRNSVISLKLTLGSRRSSGAETATAELEAEQDPTLGRGLSDAARSNDGTEDRGTAGGGQKHQRTKSSGWEGGESGGNRTGSSRNDRGQSQRSNPIGGKTEDGNGSDSSSAHGPSRSSSPGLSYDVDGDEDSDEAAQADEGEEAEEVVEEEEQEDPFGGIISGEDADTSKTVPSQADIERFEQSKQSAEAKLGGAVVSLAGSSSGGRSARRSSLGRLVLTSPGPSSVAVSAVRISPRSRPSTLETPSRSRQGSHPANETPASASPAVSAPPNSDPVNQATSAQTGTASPIKCIRFGEYDIDTWYQAPYPEEYSMVPDGRLWICEFCLKYMKSRFMASRHRTKCKMRHPPGDEIYRDGGISIFEVDGRKNKIYCQNLCLLAKMFLDHKTLYYDVEPFLFYVVTEVNHLGAHFVGYFSKEKRSSMSYNLSCIMTLPIRQRRGWGNYLIDISYLLSKKEGRVGSPEKPLSDLGLLSYRNYWTLAVFYYLRTAPDRVTMNEISAATAMTLEDVFYVLREQDMLSLPDSPSGRMRTPATSKYRGREGPSTPAATPTPRPRGRPRKNPETPRDHKHKPNGAAPLPTEYRIHFDRDYVNAHLKNYEAKGYLKVRPEKLKWTPFLMARSSVPAKMPTIQSLASSLRSLPDSQTAEEVTHGASLGKDTNTADGPGGPEATPDDKQRIGSSQSISAAPKMDASPDQSRPRGRKALKRQAVEEAAEVPLQPAVQSSDRSAGLENTLGLSYALPDMATLTSAEAAPFTATRLPFDPSFQHAYALSPKLAPDAQETPAMDERPSTEACGSSAALALNFEASSSADNVAGNAAAAADPGANNADADPSANACDQRTMSEATSPAQGHLLTDLEDAVHHPQTSHPEDAMSIPFDASMIDPSLMMGSDGAGNVDVDGTDEDAPGSDDPEMAL